jgi:hypothetical protein
MMIPQPYKQLTRLEILSLCDWREAQNQPRDAMRGVAHVVRNRTFAATWWDGHKGGDYHAVILDPFQFSSFNPGDPGADKWPRDNDPSWLKCQAACLWVPCGVDEDLTDGAQFYYDDSISWPAHWGPQSNFTNTLNVGNLLFWKLKRSQSLKGMDLRSRL